MEHWSILGCVREIIIMVAEYLSLPQSKRGQVYYWQYSNLTCQRNLVVLGFVRVGCWIYLLSVPKDHPHLWEMSLELPFAVSWSYGEKLLSSCRDCMNCSSYLCLRFYRMSGYIPSDHSAFRWDELLFHYWFWWDDSCWWGVLVCLCCMVPNWGSQYQCRHTRIIVWLVYREELESKISF